MRFLSAVLGGLVLAGLVHAQKEEPFDFKRPESPRKPPPAWVKVIDQAERDAKLKGYLTPQGIQLDIVATSAVVANPVGMAFGDDGTLYVLEWTPGDATPVQEIFTSKDGTKRTITSLKKPVKDLVKALRDTNGDGVYDEAKVILEEELPSGILLHDGWLYLSGRGTVRRYRQSRKDGPYDVKEVIAQGFGGLHHAQVSGLTLGNDGWLYITSGSQDNQVEGSDGSQATVLRSGAIFRCKPDGSKLHVFAIGFHNPYRDVAFDIGCQMFHIDNDSRDGGKWTGCRLIQVAEDADYGWRQTATGQADPFRAAVWGELPGKLTPMLKTGRGGPAGLLIYEENRFPEPYRGLAYYPDVVRQSIRAYALRPLGSTFEVTHEFELLKSAALTFRPCQMIVGPDGAMYICSTPLAAPVAPAANDPAALTPRIFKLSWSGTAEQPAIPLRGLDSWARLADKSIEQLQEMMAAENQSDRLRAQRELVRRGGPEIRALLLKDLEDSERELLGRVSALGALNSLWDRDVKLAFLRIVEGAGSPDLRRLAAEGLALNARPGDIEAQAALLRALGDQNLAARRAIALAMGRVGHPDAADALVAAFKFNRENDPILADGYLRALERLGKPGIDKLVELSLSGDDKDFDRVVEAFTGLRTRAAADAIPELLKYPHLRPPQAIKLLETYRHILTEPPLPLTAVAEYLTAHVEAPTAVKLAGLQTLALGGQLTGERLENLAINLLDDEQVRGTTMELIGLGRVKRAAPKLAGLLAKTNQPETAAILQALRLLEDRSVAPVVKETALLAKLSAPLRGEALGTLAVLDAAAAQDVAKSFLAEQQAGLAPAAVLVLGATPAGAKQMATAFLADKLPANTAPQVIAVLRRHAAQDAEAAKLLSQVLKQ